MRTTNFIFHLLSGILFLLIIPFVTGCRDEADFPEASSSQEALTLRVTASDFADDASGPTTRTTDKELKTTFAEGDCIGLYAVNSSGTVVMENLRFEYKDGEWTSSSKLYHYSNATYFAYSPYDASFTGKDIKTTDDLIDAFDLPDAGQSTREEYEQADSMTATGTLSGTTLTLDFTHAMALVEVVLPNLTYIFTDSKDVEVSSIPRYYIPYASEAKFTKTQFYQHGPSTYRCILSPGVKTTVSGTYVDPSGLVKKYSTTVDAAQAVGGKRHRIWVDCAEDQSTIRFAYSQGDLMFRDGTLMRKDEAKSGGKHVLTEEQKANVLGIIVYANNANIKMGEAETEDLSQKSITPHGYVLALKNASDGVAWSSSYVNLDAIPDATTVAEMNDDHEGLSHTRALATNSNTQALLNAIQSFGGVRPESLTTEWFLPSAGQWFSVLRKLCADDITVDSFQAGAWNEEFQYTSNKKLRESINNKLLNIDSSGSSYFDEFVSYQLYWSSSEFNTGHACSVYFKSDQILAWAAVGMNEGRYVRCILAF